MGFLFLIGLSYLLYIDAEALYERDREVYSQTVRLTPFRWLVINLLLMVFVWPVYILRRKNFLKAFREKNISLPSGDQETMLPYIITACGILIHWVFGVLIFYVVVYWSTFALPFLKIKLNEMLILGVYSSGLMVFLIFAATRRPPYQGFLKSVNLHRAGQSFFKIIIVPLLIGISLALLSSSIMVTRETMPSTPMNKALQTADSSLALILFVLLAIGLAPLLEEIIFRGYFFSVLKKIKGRLFAVCFISLAFAVLHIGQYWGDWMAIFIVGLMGLCLTLIRSWTGSTVASAVTHYTYNFLLVLIPIMTVVNFPYLKYQVMYEDLDSKGREEYLLQSIERHPQFYDAYNDLAWIYAQDERNLYEALVLIETALMADPKNPAYLDTKAEILYHMGFIRDAIVIEEELIKKHPDDLFLRQQLEKFKKAEEKEGVR